MHWTQRKKPKLSSKYDLWKNQEKPPKITIFGDFGQKWSFVEVFPDFFQKPFFVESYGFLRGDQCIKTLLSSYPNQLFWQFYRFSLKWVGGGVKF